MSSGNYLQPADILNAGKTYTFKFTLPAFEVPLPMSSLQSYLIEYMADYGQIITVNKPWFHSEVEVVVSPSGDYSMEAWTVGFNQAFNQIGMGYGGTILQSVQAGEKTSSIVEDITGQAGEGVGNIISGILKSTWPYLTGGLLLYFMVTTKRTRRT